jgi:hypothetical protein
MTVTRPVEINFYQLVRGKQSINYQQFVTLKDARYRITIKRDAYDDQSYGTVEMFMLGRGWSELLRVGLDYLHEVEELSYVQLPHTKSDPNYDSKYESILRIMELASDKLLATMLLIMAR